MSIVDLAVQQIEYVPRYHWGQGHEPPILTHAVDAERLRHQGGVAPEQEPVRETRETRDQPERVRVLDGGAADLSEEEDEGGEDEDPEAGEGEAVDDQVGADAADEPADEGHDREDLDVHELALLDQFRGGAVVVVMLDGSDVVADVAGGGVSVAIALSFALGRVTLTLWSSTRCRSANQEDSTTSRTSRVSA